MKGYNYFKKTTLGYTRLSKEEEKKYTTGAYTCITEEKIDEDIILCTMELCGMAKKLRDKGHKIYQKYNDIEKVYKIFKIEAE